MNDDIYLDDPTEDLGELEELIGIDVFVNICENFGGVRFIFLKRIVYLGVTEIKKYIYLNNKF